MKAITEYTQEEAEEMRRKYVELKESVKGLTFTDMFTNYIKSNGYASYKFGGIITDKLVEALGHEPSADEIIMLVDSGFSHFGASCCIVGRGFSGKVCID